MATGILFQLQLRHRWLNPRALALSLILLGALAQSSMVRADGVVESWHAVMETIIPASGRKNAVALPQYAYVDVAMYDAVNAIDHRYPPFAVHLAASHNASKDAAAAQAAHDVLLAHVPAQATALDAALASSLALVPDGAAKTAGIAVGRAVASQWLALRTGDGLEAPIVYTWGSGPGVWQPVPTFPAAPPNTPPAPVGVWLTVFKPFALASADQFLADVPSPPALSSAAWVLDFNRTKSYGALNSSVRTPAQTEVGLFWTADAAAQYSGAVRGLIAAHHLGTTEAVRLATIASVAASDSVTACFNAKYHFARWRPYTAITNADTDGNAGTALDAGWVPLAVTPGHPEYPAAHGCVTEAIMDALTAYFEDDEVPFSVSSAVTHTTHTFERFGDVVREVDDARIYGGMHFRSSVRAGNALGRHVADYLLKTKFRRLDD